LWAWPFFGGAFFEFNPAVEQIHLTDVQIQQLVAPMGMLTLFAVR